MSVASHRFSMLQCSPAPSGEWGVLLGKRLKKKAFHRDNNGLNLGTGNVPGSTVFRPREHECFRFVRSTWFFLLVSIPGAIPSHRNQAARHRAATGL